MQNNKIIPFIFAPILFISATPSFASLIEYDYLHNSGDRLLTFDSSSGLEWLDLTATRGRSPNEIRAGFGGYVDDGFRYASGEEVLNLFVSAGVPQGVYYDTPHILRVQSLMLMLGVTYQNNYPSAGNPFGQQTTYGMTGDTFGPLYKPWHTYAEIGASDTVAGLGVGGQIFDYSNDWLIGSFLVRPATLPEPNSALLVGLSLLLFAIKKTHR